MTSINSSKKFRTRKEARMTSKLPKKRKRDEQMRPPLKRNLLLAKIGSEYLRLMPIVNLTRMVCRLTIKQTRKLILRNLKGSKRKWTVKKRNIKNG